MSRNSFDEGDDQITPLARNLTSTNEGNRVLQMGNMAAARRKNSIHRTSPPSEFNRNRSPNNNNSPSDREQIPSELPARSKTSGGNMSRSKSMKKALGRAMSVRQAEPHVEHTISNNGFAPSRSKSLRAPPPPRLHLKRQQDGKMGVNEPIPVPDFPSPGRAPRGQRIFDPQTIAEDEGVIIEKEGGWAVDKKTQKKLDDERARIEEQERQAVFSGEDGDMKHNKTGRQRSKSFKEFFRRS
ncbi:hypothetical protein AUEXF2481DRAFT_220639 [Aureobasidium subglaciale EXF-2481]|uniref:Uncharacterized protein n=1 Tax=Aureobasidium subglaciale (strain EXF-2481) TaxID=1043005 RepID=A0A074YMZ9_AURSE|nr:uncharacterized protein AUEXF2481DRAFT_220639 [Aureobasidium subglaciale EXF-2481]KAI5195146.1 hypothetical protein E4T38_09221 [Aureobasidium subglaciale]KAI5214204.1 hypothetical protein E4T40_09135 [Aureobasidium subglaciale]KAI5216731.1 hypothetical protein E4T41_09136 [Aureobasidium subglaciale]KAI5254507.1 hypothetical protein E4T46_09128 [Aureobasidium subglaciale]KEQ95487.1 hypothetical protein AUEXF2481DRAFT_220639 [Aureobasidium subglaciale EXF-2481]